MKNLSPIAAVAACAASTAASSTMTTVPMMTKHVRWVVNSIPRGGDGQNDNIHGDNNNGNNSSNKSKKSSPPHRSGSKKKKSTKTKLEKEKTDTPTEAKNKNSNKTNNNPVIEEILQHKDFYDVLGVPNTASERDIQKAYRKRCVQTHPDKTGGDRRAFDAVSEAYDILSDQSKRQVYNRYGKAGLDPSNSGIGAGGFGDDGGASSMFRNMFQQAAQNQQQRQRRNQSLRYQLEVTLEDLYYGRTQRVQVAPPHSPFHQQQRRRKEVEVHISKGSVNGQSVILSGEVDFNDDNSPPGDLVFILTQAPHATFTRKGHDLVMALTICLEEAVCGLKRPIKHLDGTEMWIESANYSDNHSSKNKNKLNQDKNDVFDDDVDDNGSSRSIPIMIRTGDVQVLKGRGMPKRNTSDEFGDLYIQYRVEMPNSKSGKALNKEEIIELSRLLMKLEDNEGNDIRSRQSKSRRHNNNEQQHAKIKPKIYSLKEAKSSDFGTASGKVVWEDEDGIGGGSSFHEDHGDEFHSFASSHFQRGSSASSFFGSNPFGGMGGLDPNGRGNDDGNVQCQQM